MVNEINKPPTSDHLNERLAASNRQLRDMQEEHRRLLQEMETLRERATELSRLSAQRHQEQEELLTEARLKEENDINTETTSIDSKDNDVSPSSSSALPSSIAPQDTCEGATSISTDSKENYVSPSSSSALPSSIASQDTCEGTTSITTNSKDNDVTPSSSSALPSSIASHDTCEAATTTENDENASGSKTPVEDKADDAESAEYIKAKIAEIAALKAQYKRVQEMVNTTHLIEQHLSSKSTLESSTAVRNELQESRDTAVKDPNLSEIPAETENTTTSQDSKEELLNTMFNMFTNFSEDLRGQAETLRAERERIRNLKELLLQRRKGDS